MEKIKYEDLACEFCKGHGEREKSIDGADCPTVCVFCNGTGIDEDQLKKLFEQYTFEVNGKTFFKLHNMETFLLNFVNTFKEAFYGAYLECKEFRCGFFKFDNFRPLPVRVFKLLKLVEHVDYDDEKNETLFYYTTTFSA